MNDLKINLMRKQASENVLPGTYESPEVKSMDIVLEKGFAQSGEGEDLRESPWE